MCSCFVDRNDNIQINFIKGGVLIEQTAQVAVVSWNDETTGKSVPFMLNLKYVLVKLRHELYTILFVPGYVEIFAF
jgi:hypothetical protein